LLKIRVSSVNKVFSSMPGVREAGISDSCENRHLSIEKVSNNRGLARIFHASAMITRIKLAENSCLSPIIAFEKHNNMQ